MEGSIGEQLRKLDAPLELPPANEAELEATFLKYEQTPAGYQQMLDDIANSDNPRTIQFIVWLIQRKNQDQYFIHKHFSDTYPDAFLGDKRRVAYADYLKNNPEFRPLFCLEFLRGLYPEIDSDSLNKESSGWYRVGVPVDLENLDEVFSKQYYADEEHASIYAPEGCPDKFLNFF